MANNIGANRPLNIQQLHMTDENRTRFQKLANRNTLAGNSAPLEFSEKIPTYTTSGSDGVSFSAEALAMLDAQQTTGNTGNSNIQPGTANAKRAAAGQPIRDIPEEYQRYVFRHTDFRIFAEEVLSPHMENADELLAKMELAILRTNSSLMANLTLAERAMVRESILQEAQRIAETYLEGDDAQRFVEGFASLIYQAERVEMGYIRVEDRSDPNNVTFRRPFDQADNIARHDFLQGNMTAEQKAHLDNLIAEMHSQFELIEEMSRDENGNIRFDFREYMQENHPEAWETYSQAVFAVRGFMDEMADYYGFQEQWDAWQAGNAAEDNWFARAEIAFEENSAEVAEQLEEIRTNLHNQLNINGMDVFRSILNQIRSTSNDNPFWQWLMQLQVFNPLG